VLVANAVTITFEQTSVSPPLFTVTGSGTLFVGGEGTSSVLTPGSRIQPSDEQFAYAPAGGSQTSFQFAATPSTNWGAGLNQALSFTIVSGSPPEFYISDPGVSFETSAVTSPAQTVDLNFVITSPTVVTGLTDGTYSYTIRDGLGTAGSFDIIINTDPGNGSIFPQE